MMELLFRVKKGPFRNLMVHEIKAPLLKVLEIVDRQLPSPTADEVQDPNSKIMCRRRDEFVARLKLSPGRQRALRAMINLAIHMRFDEPYQQLMDWWAEAIIAERENWTYMSKDKPNRLIWEHGELPDQEPK
jgi:hypothetical protein